MKVIPLSIISWNVLGLGENDKCANIFSQRSAQRPTIALFQETKLLDPLVAEIRSFFALLGFS